MQSHQLYYMTGNANGAAGQVCCQIRDYVITALPFGASEWQRKYLIGGNGFGQKLFRFFCLRKQVKGKECVVLSDEMQQLLGKTLWYPNMTEAFPKGLQKAFALESFAETIRRRRESGKRTSLLVILPPEGITQEELEELLQEAQETENLVFYSFTEEEKEWLEDKLDDFLEETGVAGMCYLMEKENDRWENPLRRKGTSEAVAASMDDKTDRKTEDYVLLLDFAGRPPRELWGIDCYIEGGGKMSRKEIRRLKGRRVAVVTLRNYLDRAFLSTL